MHIARLCVSLSSSFLPPLFFPFVLLILSPAHASPYVLHQSITILKREKQSNGARIICGRCGCDGTESVMALGCERVERSPPFSDWSIS
ncbi:hypothetical protein BDY17DRAFT_290357 [Neohortaea acidophila]|uniref:Secreted protein n=1 Tax=Neohortaea acidophila TaxID=245834 RepID=A0A6A6Q790_9PEZI|nr:uncharacterized protein BDY17DRAFT_290357 [Neohortaea acidophila]KAF2488175.1 hypothetical protein BDY17DRAFT_290357 [Neohortaea acidophila]